ncbi:ArsR/SmtB family transcription factor [Clostridiisalibacter paucivorans]|uniref:ArsR/SmtB family transcription factor n=1 Tax=Clostridiisalibacter paucivorans TaxID=408753 RepID=UPI000478AF5E|nr:metalloregulator ArsR/SmtB family transcription factor [Clostridiisalibacter paucivorans]
MFLDDIEVKIFKALGHPVRLKIVKKLMKGTLCVCELNEDVDFSQSNLSQHLRVLRDADILSYERDGARINYSIKNKEITDIINIIEKMIIKDFKKIVNGQGD